MNRITDALLTLLAVALVGITIYASYMAIEENKQKVQHDADLERRVLILEYKIDSITYKPVVNYELIEQLRRRNRIRLPASTSIHNP